MPPKKKGATNVKAPAKTTKNSITKETKVNNDSSDEEELEIETKPKRKRANYKEDSTSSESEVEKPKKKVKKAAVKSKNDGDAPVKKPARGKKATNDTQDKPAPAKNKSSTSYDNINFDNCTKKNGKGEDWNFKIANWNVDGIRAWVKKGGLDYIKYEKPDIFCLQETKCNMEKLPAEVKDVEGYKVFWHCSEKDGYAGVALYSKVDPISVKYGIDDPDHDNEGRMITAEYDKFYVVSVYVPNSGRGLVTLPKRLKWNKSFSEFVSELDQKKPVIICGDMNVAHLEIDLANPKTNTKNAGFTKEERDGMTEFLTNGYVDTFRNLYPDLTKAYTFWTYMSNCRAKNVGWRLDYFITSERLMDSVCDNIIRSEVYGSDHCPIVLFMKI